MDLVFGIITDLHFGPVALHEGKLRKMTHEAGALARAFARRMRDEVHPAFVVNLGDDLEDESPEADRARYAECADILKEAGCPVLHVAGNHDTVHLSPDELLAVWDRPVSVTPVPPGELFYSVDWGGYHLVVLHTRETKDVSVRIDDAQLDWLARDLAAGTAPVIVLMHHSAADQVLVGNPWFEKAAHICLVAERKRLRAILEASGRVIAVFNGHVHWNHLDVIGGIAYVTVQSLIENLDPDAPGRAAAAHAVVRVTRSRVLVEIEGAERARYQIERR